MDLNNVFLQQKPQWDCCFFRLSQSLLSPQYTIEQYVLCELLACVKAGSVKSRIVVVYMQTEYESDPERERSVVYSADSETLVVESVKHQTADVWGWPLEIPKLFIGIICLIKICGVDCFTEDDFLFVCQPGMQHYTGSLDKKTIWFFSAGLARWTVWDFMILSCFVFQDKL